MSGRKQLRGSNPGGNSDDSPRRKNRLVKKGKASQNDDDDDSIDSKGNIRGLIAYTDEENDSAVSEESPRQIRPPKRAAAKKADKIIKKKLSNPKKRVVALPKKAPVVVESEEDEDDEEEPEVESEEEDYDEEEDDEDQADLEDDDEDEEEEPAKKQAPAGISISFGSFGEDSFMERMVPKRYNMKKEPVLVKKFVELVTNPPTESTIDDQIDQFKSLPSPIQHNMIEALERRPKTDASSNGQSMMLRILTMKTTPEIQTLILSKYNALQSLDPSTSEYFKMRNWLEKATSLPIGDYKEMPVKLEDGTEKCSEFMKKAISCLDTAIYGQHESKLQILQFIASKVTNNNSRGLSLLLVGPPGIGKTSLIKNGIAKALDWPFQFISLGGDSDASTYTGHQLVYESSHTGKIVNSLISAKSLSTVLMFDEVDKISNTPKGEEVQHLLIHLTDPVQNDGFEDKYLAGIPVDLSKVMFVFSANDINKLDKVLLDRFVVIQLEGYKKPEKMAIAEKFLWPEALAEVNLGEKVALTKDVLDMIIEDYANDESGVRELKRCMSQITQKINMLRMFNTKELPFHIPDFKLPFVLKKEHVKLFLKKREDPHKAPQGMYM